DAPGASVPFTSARIDMAPAKSELQSSSQPVGPPANTSTRHGFVDSENSRPMFAALSLTSASASENSDPRGAEALPLLIPVSPGCGSTSYATTFDSAVLPLLRSVTRYLMSSATGETGTLCAESAIQSQPSAAESSTRQISFSVVSAAAAPTVTDALALAKFSVVLPSPSMTSTSAYR